MTFKGVAWGVSLAMLAATGARAQSRGAVGGGVVVGDPIGASLKVWTGATHAAAFGVGVSGDTTFWADSLWHGWSVLPQPKSGRLAPYLLLGGRVEARRDAEFGVRTLGGLTYWLAQNPLELFLEAGPLFRLTPKGSVDADIGLGLRYYFAGPSPAKSGT